MLKIAASPANYLRLGASGFLCGVALASFLPVVVFDKLWIWSLLVAVSLVFFVSIKFDYFRWSLVALFFVVGIWRFAWDYSQSQAVINLPNGLYNAEAEIVESPRWVRGGQELIVDLASGSKRNLISVKTGYSQAYQAGQRIWLKCRLRKTENNQSYLRARDLASACYQAEITVLDSRMSWLAKLRVYLAESISKVSPEPAAALATAMLFGQRQALSPVLLKSFSDSGLSHLIAISGMNISLLVWLMMLGALAVGLSRRQAYYLTILLIGLFVVLVGAEASVVRAALMGLLVISAPQVGRQANFKHILIVSAALMVLIKPTWLIFDLGFQLSFLALAGLVYFYSGLELCFEKLIVTWPEWLMRIVKVPMVIVIATVSAQLLTLPLLAWRFGYLSMVSIPANVMTVWTMPLVMIGGLIATLMSLLSDWLGLLAWLPMGLLLDYIIWVSNYFASWPIATWQIPDWAVALLVLLYIPEYYLAKYLALLVASSDRKQFL